MVAAGAGAALLGGHARRQAPKVETAVANPKAKRPNILIIMSDQERLWSSLPNDLPRPATSFCASRASWRKCPVDM